jgi:uncharacterized short protein YbdD (DUF466 family)
MIARMHSEMQRFQGAVAWTAWWLRQVLGDSAYENYLRSTARPASEQSDSQPLSAEEFYLDALRRRYSGVSRCC